MIAHSVVGFKHKKFDLVHQIVFIVRGVVWAREYRLPTQKGRGSLVQLHTESRYGLQAV